MQSTPLLSDKKNQGMHICIVYYVFLTINFKKQYVFINELVMFHTSYIDIMHFQIIQDMQNTKFIFYIKKQQRLQIHQLLPSKYFC